MTGALSGGVLLVAFALTLGAGPLTIGFLAAIPFTIGLGCALAGGLAPLAAGLVAHGLEARQLSVVVRWVSPFETGEVSVLQFVHFEFLFAVSAMLGLYVMHALSRIREGTEISERRVMQEFPLEALRTVNQVSSIGGPWAPWCRSNGCRNADAQRDHSTAPVALPKERSSGWPKERMTDTGPPRRRSRRRIHGWGMEPHPHGPARACPTAGASARLVNWNLGHALPRPGQPPADGSVWWCAGVRIALHGRRTPLLICCAFYRIFPMRADLYRRIEANNELSFLAVPEGQAIPEEATNVDWQKHAQAVPLGDEDEILSTYGIEGLTEQVRQKGYAITGVQHRIADVHSGDAV